jgi:large subunit ribosomal protein L25
MWLLWETRRGTLCRIAMDRLSLKAEERTIFGKKVKNLRSAGLIPAHVFGNTKEVEHVSVNLKDFALVYDQAGETGVIDLKIGAEKTRPVMVKDSQYNPVNGQLLHIDFYQVNLNVAVTVPVPVVLVGEEPELVHSGEAIVLQTINELQVEALPGDLVDQIEVNIEVLKEVDDAITVENLNYDRSKLTVHAEPAEVVVKLAPAVTAEMEALLEEQEAEAEANMEEEQAEATAEAGEEAGEIERSGDGENADSNEDSKE